MFDSHKILKLEIFWRNVCISTKLALCRPRCQGLSVDTKHSPIGLAIWKILVYFTKQTFFQYTHRYAFIYIFTYKNPFKLMSLSKIYTIYNLFYTINTLQLCFFFKLTKRRRLL